MAITETFNLRVTISLIKFLLAFLNCNVKLILTMKQSYNFILYNMMISKITKNSLFRAEELKFLAGPKTKTAFKSHEANSKTFDNYGTF